MEFLTNLWNSQPTTVMVVGAAIVATTKSLSVIVGFAFSGSLTDEILILAPISRLAKSTIRFSGIFSRAT